MSATKSTTATYTTIDIENVCRRMKADIAMIADSTGAWTAAQAANYAHDIELLAKNGYLAWVDVTLFSSVTEIKAVRYDVDLDSGSLSANRPGGVLWPKVLTPRMRVVVGYTQGYDDLARQAISQKLKMSWTPNHDDTTHSSLANGGGRNYTSNAYGMKRKDWSK